MFRDENTSENCARVSFLLIPIDKVGGMLNNERFVANAPEDVLSKNRELLADAKAKQVKVKEQLNSLKN